MESTIEKLNQNRLMELTSEDYSNIVNNTELKTLFLQKIKEGHKFDIEEVYVLEEDLLSPEYITIVFDMIKELNPDQYIEYFFLDQSQIREQFDEKTAETVIKYLEDNMHFVLSKLQSVEQPNEKITNPEIIENILTNKLEKHYGSIFMDPPTEEFEAILLDALERNEYNSIFTMNPKILKKCLETNNAKGAMYGIHPDNPEETELIFTALAQEQITYEELPYNFRQKHKSELRFIKYQLRNETYISLSNEDLERKEVRQLIIDEIEKNHNLANDWHLAHSCQNYPELALVLIKYWDKETMENMISYKEETIKVLLKEYKEELIDSIIFNLEHNQSAIEDIIIGFYKSSTYKYDQKYEILEHPRFFKYYTTKMPIEKIISYLISYKYGGEHEYYINPTRYTLLEKAEIEFHTIPQDFNFKINYPENVWLALIPKLSKEQLNPNNINLSQFIQYERIFDCILKRLKELKSNSYNSSLEYWQGPVTQTLIDIVCDPENPLNLNTTQKFRILPQIKMTNTNHLPDILKQAETIEYNDLQVLIPIILQMENIDEIKKICSIMLPKLDKSINTLNYIGSISADVFGSINQKTENKTNISEQHLAFYECIKEYLKTQKDIPLSLTQYFDKEIAKIATYNNTDNLVKNPEFFLVNETVPNHFIEFIKECQSKNLPIDLKLISKAVESSANTELYNYENIKFGNDSNTYDILFKLLSTKDSNSLERQVVNNWVKNNLTYKIFDCQLEANKKNFLELLIIRTEYTEQILNAIKADKINDITVLSSVINKMLILKRNNPEQTKKVLDIIIELIEQNKVNIFQPDYDIDKYIELVDHPTFIKYVKNTYVKNISNHTQTLKSLLKSEKYKQATLDALYTNLNLFTNTYVLELIKEFTEIKEYVKYSLENTTNSWINFNTYFLDPDLLKAFLKNNSIDKVITFIVHNQNVTLITKEIYTIIKENLLKAHQEYNKESLNILEELYGLELLLLLETTNFQKLLQKDPKIVRKFVEVFKERKLDEGIITSINDSFKQNYFNIENTHIINFYTSTLEKIQRGITPEEISDVILALENYIPTNLEKDIEATENELLLNLYKTNKKDFLSVLIQELIKNQNIYAPLFNKITNNLIVQKRNEYRSTQDIYKDTNLKYELDTKSLYNTLFNYLSRNYPQELIDIIEFTKYDTDLNWKTIYFLSGDTTKYTKEELPQIKRNILPLKTIILNAFDYMNEKDKQPTQRYSSWYWERQEEQKKFDNLPRKYEFLLSDPEFTKSIKKIPIYPTRKNPIEMFGNINIEVFELLTKDEEKYKALITLLNKYRFLEWQDLFAPTVQKLSLGEDAINIFNFINAFSKIYDNEKKIILRERKKLIVAISKEMKKSGKSQKEIENYIRIKEAEPININITAYKVLKYSTIYSSIANYYKIILGMEDFDLVKRNDGPNSSYHSAEERLQRTAEMQIKMFTLNEITIPSFIHDHETNPKTKTKLRVTVGNRANSRNLTHGERTGACMRAHGHADSLFEFCNLDPRGFHIVFTDPETNEYVSRVSGFRNGNTVFLNQLRYSTSSKYSNEDVIAACKAVAEELIERTKDSEMPIENVVASPYYALASYETQLLSEHNIGEGVYTGYKDVNSNAVVLATIGENNKALPLKLDGKNQPIYEPIRLQPQEYTMEQITDGIKILLQRITVIKECLKNKDNPYYYKTTDFDYELLETQYIHIILGQDWFVALDIHGNITQDIAIQNEHSIEELNEAIAKINTIKETKQKIGGFSNGI